MDREAWRAVIHGVAKSRTWLSDLTELNWLSIPHRLYPFIWWWALGLVLISAIVNSAAGNTGGCVSLPVRVFVFFRWIPRSGVARSCGSLSFSFLRYLHTVFCGDCSWFHSYQQRTSVPFYVRPHQRLLVSFFIFGCAGSFAGLGLAPVAVRWPLTVMASFIAKHRL